jgi:hypothetical protein
MRKRYITLLIGISLSFPALSQDSTVLADRDNVMECSYEEVAAYMALPDPERRVMHDYDSWQTAFQSTEVVRSSTDPSVCLSVLYGDISSSISDELSRATQSLMSMQIPGISEIFSTLSSKLMESVCSRAESIRDDVADRIITETDNLRAAAENELMEKYSMDAMTDYVEDAVIPPEFSENGIKYRNGKISTSSFQRQVKSRWSSELDELRDDVVGT